MSALDDEVRLIKARVDQAQRDRARAEAVVEHARATLNSAAAALQEEFNVRTLEEAVAARDRLEADLRVKLADVRASLDAMGAEHDD